MDIIRPKESDSKLNGYYFTFGDLKHFVSNHPDIPDDCRVLVQQIDEEYKESWIDSKFYVVNADSSLVGEYWQAWSAYYNEEKNLLLIHLHY